MRGVPCAVSGFVSLPMSIPSRTTSFAAPLRHHVHAVPSPRHVTHARTIVAAATTRRMPPMVRPVVPSETLCQFVEDKAQSRAVILKSLSAYVKEHNLQDPNNRRIVLCDEKLRGLFGVEQCTILEMSKYVNPHLQKPEALGGRYIDEAKAVEDAYFEQKRIEEELQEKTGTVSKKSRARVRAAKQTTEDRKAGRKLFKPVILSDELSAICRSQKEMPRQDIVKAVWDYIRLNNLQAGPGEPIKCDFLLKRVYNADHIDVRTIMKGIGAHVTKKE